MLRSHNCGELKSSDINKTVTLSGWVQKVRDKGFIIWVDLRDRYGITQLVFDEKRSSKRVFETAKELSREFVIQISGKVIERESKNTELQTGNIELLVSELNILNASETPPFTIEDKTDGGEELRMQYRYLDIRRNNIRKNLIFRHKVTMEVRNYLNNKGFIDIETPYLIKSTPEGARDFVVPSRMNSGEFYALPQSPQTFKQLLMVGGIDRYFQIVKCFRDEDLRADRQPEFTQIDCEMSFVDQEDVLNQFEGLISHLIMEINNYKVGVFPRITYNEAINNYGSDKPDIRFDMKFGNITDKAKGKGFKIFDSEELIIGFSIKKGASFSRKEIDNWISWVKQPQIGAKGIVWVKYNEDKSLKSSVDKFYSENDLTEWIKIIDADPGDLIFILSGKTKKTLKQLGELRLAVAEKTGLRNPEIFAPLWVTDFPLLEWDEKSKRYHAMHHPFTSPKKEDLNLLNNSPEKVRANAYDLVLNGNEVGGGSIRIHDSKLQKQMFNLLGFSDEDAQSQFGFLMGAFKYGAPPHGGIAFGLDRLVAILGGKETIRDFIAFPKNNSGRDTMIDSPSLIEKPQLDELGLELKKI
ncbi:MAG: aspartyl-tRNA synthetase [Candidatus Marivariicella framensis]|jgi:aspartyl-tRNA synthetase|tara:strand:- start:1163 stop:2914 length:1752 start_codon:yes stop_codon:yes gene_type:complete